ncbi:MAG: response regulator [Bacteroidota bacterium]|nr:response regulator [Bacteroidota bacterium]
MSSQSTILIIDDEPQIRRLVEVTLSSNEYSVIAAATGEEGMREAAMRRPNLIITDLGLPDVDGNEVVQRLREWYDGPIIVLSVRDSEQEIASLLDAGADDYCVKPFRPFELLARIRAALRHHESAPKDSIISFGDVVVNLAARTVAKSGADVRLTSLEYSLLALLVRNADKVLTHRYLLEQVWGKNYAEETQYLRIYIGQLRKKLEDNPAEPKHILTESRVGYRLITTLSQNT